MLPWKSFKELSALICVKELAIWLYPVPEMPQVVSEVMGGGCRKIDDIEAEDENGVAGQDRSVRQRVQLNRACREKRAADYAKRSKN